MATSNLDSIELHDAIIESINMDFSSAAVTVHIAYYPNAESQRRIQGKLSFENVESIFQAADFTRLQQNSAAGNINYWRPSNAGQVTVHLSR